MNLTAGTSSSSWSASSWVAQRGAGRSAATGCCGGRWQLTAVSTAGAPNSSSAGRQSAGGRTGGDSSSSRVTRLVQRLGRG